MNCEFLKPKDGVNTLPMSSVCNNRSFWVKFLLTLTLNWGHGPWCYRFPGNTITKVEDLGLVSM